MTEDKSNKVSAPELPQPIEGFPDFGFLNLRAVGNARDLGGLPAADGRRIKKGRLLRSGDLNAMASLDGRYLMDTCGLRHIVDLRTKAEAEAAPDPILRLPRVSYTFSPALAQEDVGSLDLADLRADVHVLAEFTVDGDGYMRGLYSKCLLGEEGQRTYKRLLHGLLCVPQGATLWHCTQGKDRTGIAAMLIEHALGVSQQDIMQDYLATNLFMDGWLQRIEQFLRGAHLAHLIDRDLEAYTYAKRGNLEEAYSAVQQNFGSLDAYMEEVLDFGPLERAKLRELYLE